MKYPQRKPHKIMSTEELVKKAYKQAGVKELPNEKDLKDILKNIDKNK